MLERVKDVGEGLDREYAVVTKSAFLVHSLIVHHPFVNGNKRTAFAVVESFLELNGYELRAGVQEKYRFLADVGAGKVSPLQAEDWIATNLAKKRRKLRQSDD